MKLKHRTERLSKTKILVTGYVRKLTVLVDISFSLDFLRKFLRVSFPSTADASFSRYFGSILPKLKIYSQTKQELKIVA